MADITAPELLILNVDIGCPTTDWDFGERLLNVFVEQDQRLAPETLHVWSDKVGDFKEPNDAKAYWAGVGQIRSNGSMSEFRVGLSWKRKRVTSYQAEIRHETRNTKGRKIGATLSLYAVPHKQIDWKAFANEIYAITEANFGFLHIYRDAHKRSDLSEAREPIIHLGDVTKTTLPDLAWSTFIGSRYATSLKNADLSDNEATITKINDGISITITENVMDICSDFQSFDKKRQSIKSHFPSGFFTGYPA